MNTLTVAHHRRLEDYMAKAFERAKHFIGYPIATDFDYSELYPLLSLPLNNVGDPFVESTYDLNSRSIEVEVLQFFASIFRAPENNWWGYVTNGGSEGNLYSLYIARELYPEGIVYYSEATHYSVQKNIQLLGLRSIVIRTNDQGEMDYDDLEQMIQLHREKPVIVLANIGTTMTEAKDDLGAIRKVFKRSAIRNHYIHCDAALAGVYSALLELEPGFDFSFGADSIAISGHKFIGSPIPCGVVLVKKNYKDRIGKAVSYIGTLDTTISGSRNGHSPLFLWYAIKRLGVEGLRQRAVDCLAMAAYVVERFQSIGIPAWRNPSAITVVFPAPGPLIRQKWQLATEGGWSHIICMPGCSKTSIDEFMESLQREGALPNFFLKE
ncbi:histidine decarboxylase [Dinghuibacter silviterrae]|uniref:L-histidine carboxy-lyase (Histamine-forming) n=1 Tax=Dinghuibacter silviterrae TaxID=1539049 RepID=A0A4R8DGJ2_9BACT|nr:histidine decarboxylase [Dinghuibacter silviterrae]TDW96364.1 L-histidine carboxy-lyase (histamine-forming) [Dinghuibacter silviterrae]